MPDSQLLIRQMELLRRVCSPELLRAADALDTPSAWAIGTPEDAVAIAAAYRLSSPDDPPAFRVFNPGRRGEPSVVSFALGDIASIPAEFRDKWFERYERRFVPERCLAEQVVLSEPTALVDLVVLRGDGPSRTSAATAARWLRPGGVLFFVGEPSEPVLACFGLSALDEAQRIYRKTGESHDLADMGGATAPNLATSPLRGSPSSDDAPTTLAEMQMQMRLVEGHVRLAWALARRFSRRGEAADDLDQVALLALVKAARRFDPSRDIAFSTFATASILGELKRHFRDKTWMLRVPRSLQELFLSVKHARDELSQQLGCSPTPAQIAHFLGVTEDAVRDAMEAGDNYWPASLDSGSGDDGSPTEIAFIDTAFDHSLDRHRLSEVLPRLEEREQLIIKRLYFDQWTQRQVAEEIGVSQMQVSRLLLRTVSKLRSWLSETPAA